MPAVPDGQLAVGSAEETPLTAENTPWSLQDTAKLQLAPTGWYGVVYQVDRSPSPSPRRRMFWAVCDISSVWTVQATHPSLTTGAPLFKEPLSTRQRPVSSMSVMERPTDLHSIILTRAKQTIVTITVHRLEALDFEAV